MLRKMSYCPVSARCSGRLYTGGGRPTTRTIPCKCVHTYLRLKFWAISHGSLCARTFTGIWCCIAYQTARKCWREYGNSPEDHFCRNCNPELYPAGYLLYDTKIRLFNRKNKSDDNYGSCDLLSKSYLWYRLYNTKRHPPVRDQL